MFRRRPVQRPSLDRLDHILFHWQSGDAYRLRDLVNGGACILGRTGSGKTSASLYWFAWHILSQVHCGGFILAASLSDVAWWRKLFADLGIADRLLVFDENSRYRFNGFDYLLRLGAGTRDIVKALVVVGETLSRNQGGGGRDGDSFFIKAEQRLLWAAVEILRLATGKVTAYDLIRFINSAALSPHQLGTEEWKASFHCQMLEAAHNAAKGDIEVYDNDLAREFWLGEYPPMSDKTRSSILAGVMNTLHTFNTGLVRKLLSTTTNITPQVMDEGKFILVNTPIARLGEEGLLILTLWKYFAQIHTLRRDPSRDNTPLIGFVDEFQNTVNSEDTRFLAEARKTSGSMIALSQSVSSFYAAMGGGERGKASVNALLANFTHKLFHALGDVETAEWASKLVGSELHSDFGGTEQPPASLWDSLNGRGVYSGSYHESMRPRLEPTEFMHGLRTGGQSNDYLCDTILVKSGEAFKGRRNWQRVTFSQER